MKTIEHVQAALKSIEEDVNALMMNPTMPMNEKDAQMLSLLQQRRVLEQTLSDLTYLKEHPPTQSSCGIARYRIDD